MAGNSTQYTVPLAIDPSGFLTGLDQMEEGLVSITSKAKGASTAITEAMTASNKAGDQLVTKMNQGAQAAKALSDAAKATGTDINKAFGDVKTTGLEKVSQFVAQLRDSAGKPVDFKFNIDQAAVKVLVDKLTQAKTEMSAFNLILSSAKDRLAGLQAGSPAFVALQEQISTADEFVKKLMVDVEGLSTETETVGAGTGIPKLGDEASNTVEKIIPLRTQLKLMKQELQQMEEAGQLGSARFIELSKRAGEVADQIGDTSKRVQALASDTKGLDAGITAIRGLAGAFATAQGAMALFGDQNEEVQKTIAKVQGAMALLQGVQEVANVLNKDSALIVYLKTFALKENTVATVGNTVATEAGAVATGAATVATKSFTLALLSNPIVLITAAIVAATYAIYKFVSSNNATKIAVEEANKQIEAQVAALGRLNNLIEVTSGKKKAEAELARKNQSDIAQAELDAIEERFNTTQGVIDELLEKRNRLQKKNTDEAKKAVEEANKKINEVIDQQAELLDKKAVLSIQLQKIRYDEQVKLEQDFLQAKQNKIEVERAIVQLGINYLNEIEQSKIAAMKEGQEKEIDAIDQNLKEKIKSIETEKKINIEKLANQRDNLLLELKLADDNGKLVINKQLENVNREIQEQAKANKKANDFELQLTEAANDEKLKVIVKYQNKVSDFQHDLQIKTLDIQKESAAKQVAILTENAAHDIDLVQRSDETKLDKLRQYILIFEKLQKDIAASNLDFTLKQIEIDKTSNDNKLMEQKIFFDKSRDAQATFHLLQAQNELDAANKALKALKDAGKTESDQEYVNAKNRADQAKKGVSDATKDAKKQNLFELLFPNDNAAQANAKEFIVALGEVGKAIDAYTALQVAALQRQVDAQKKVVSNDDDAISKLQDQLNEEKSLRDKGYANNVDGVKKLLAEKNKQRDEDIRKADEYQKKMQKIQKAQITAQAILQGVQLATAATNVLLQSTAEGGAIGAVIGGLAVAAMIGAFIAEKKAAYDAANAQATTFGGGGIIKGKSHSQGGQKFYAPDATGGIMELEEGEHVTSKKQTEKYLPLLQIINHDKLKDMDDQVFLNLLDGLGVHLQTDRQHKEALRESREHTSHHINQISIEANPRTPKELVSIDNTLTQMANRNHDQVQTWEENGYIVTKKGSHIKRVRKH